MFNLNCWLVFVSLFVQTVICADVCDGNSTINTFCEENEGRVLSRRKRFVTFPVGSSFQCGFILQTAAVIPIGDIFLFGNAASLAWMLPTDPQFLYMFKKYEKPQARMDTINYLDETAKVIARVPVHKRPIVNPAFGKRSVDNNELTLRRIIDRKKMHENQLQRDYLKGENLDTSSVEFHRSNRVELYRKIEALLTALGRDGRACVLYKLCEAAKGSEGQKKEQGTFLQEFLRALFTLPKGPEFEYEEHREYDKAHTVMDDCSSRYPGCDGLEIAML